MRWGILGDHSPARRRSAKLPSHKVCMGNRVLSSLYAIWNHNPLPASLQPDQNLTTVELIIVTLEKYRNFRSCSGLKHHEQYLRRKHIASNTEKCSFACGKVRENYWVLLGKRPKIIWFGSLQISMSVVFRTPKNKVLNVRWSLT